MSMRTIVVPWWHGNDSPAQLDAALAVARQVEAHLDVVFIRPDPPTTLAALDNSNAAPAAIAEQIDSGYRRAAAEARIAFDMWRERQGIPDALVGGQIRSVFARWSERTGPPEQVIVRKGRLGDLTVLGFPDASGRLDRALDAAVFETGRPVLIVPQHASRPLLSHVVIAWNGSLQATRAVAGAMSLLHEAEQVTVLTTRTANDRAFADADAVEDFDLPGALRWHGITAGHHVVDASEHATGEALLQAATNQDATLFVMGAYTHSRVTTAFLSGVTGHVLRHPPSISVLMAH